jgi:hypothetical protein
MITDNVISLSMPQSELFCGFQYTWAPNCASMFLSDKMNVFNVGKRIPPFSHWEPIFVGTHSDPYYDERLTWEGRSDKMTQVYQVC